MRVQFRKKTKLRILATLSSARKRAAGAPPAALRVGAPLRRGTLRAGFAPEIAA